jgi:L-asparaginase
MRQGSPHLYFAPPAHDPLVEGRAGGFAQLPLEQLRQRVYVWTVAAGMAEVPEALLGQCEGLVLAAPGTGSLPASMIAQLSPRWAGGRVAGWLGR